MDETIFHFFFSLYSTGTESEQTLELEKSQQALSV